MIISVSYYSKNKDKAGEIKCPFNQLGTIFNFIKDNPNKRINITCGDLSSDEVKRMIEQVEFVKEVANDYTIECGDIAIFYSLRSNGYNAYLRFPITDWEAFQNLKTNKVSDIYIDGPLGFQCRALKDGKENIKIRVSPTVSPNSVLVNRSINSFFIRPEDIDLYRFAIDVLDFKVADQDLEDTLFDIYSRNFLYYDIDKLINGLPKINNTFFNSEFAENRLNCGQKCKIPGRSCNYCDTYIKTAESLNKMVRNFN